MAAQIRTLSAAGQSGAIRLLSRDFKGAGVGLVLSITGTLTASVEVTGNNQPYTNWVALTDMANLTASALGNIAYPVTAVRLNVTDYTSGSAELSVVQGGSDE